MRLVADTNVVVSGLLWPGAPRRLLDLGRQRVVHLVTTEQLLDELSDVLSRPKFVGRIERAGLSCDSLVDAYRGITDVVVAADIPRTVITDPDDDMVLAAAVAGNVDLVVSGDRDLLDLRHFRQLRIIGVQEALDIVGQVGA